MSKIIIGVATLPSRKEFFENKCLPSLVRQKEGPEVIIYHDLQGEPPEEGYSERVTRLYGSSHNWGDIGKFGGFQYGEEDFYYFTCDDDLIYPPDYCERMIEWIDFFEKKAVVSLHGSYLSELPIKSYYRNRKTIPCLGDEDDLVRVIFPGTGCAAFHSSTVRPLMKDFKVPNMADIWFGLILQREEVPAIVLPHSGDYLTYNPDLPLQDTIWGRYNKDDFVQTAIVNQFSLSQGFQLLPWPVPLEDDLFRDRPDPLVPSPVPRSSG